MMKFKSIFLVCLAMSTILVFGSNTKAGETPQRGGTFKIISGITTKALGAPWEVDPWFTIYGNPAVESLVRIDKAGSIIPHLATSWKMAADGKSYVFELRKGVKFHDGTNFNAEAVKFNIEHLKRGTIAVRLESAQVIDDYTIKLNLKQADSGFLADLTNLSGMIVSPTAAQKKSTPENMARDHLVGTGPYTFVDWSRDEYIKYKRFDGYWQKGKPYFDAMEFKFIVNPVTSIIAFQSGAAHLHMKITAQDARDLKAKGYEILSFLNAVKAFNPDSANANSPWANKKVREALSHAIDRDAITKAIGLGTWDPIYQACPDKSWPGYLDDIEERKYDPKQAKKLLAEAGYPNGFETKVFARPEDNQDMLAAVQNYLAEIGIKAKIELIDRGRYVSLHEQGWSNGIFFNSFGARSYEYSNNLRSLTGISHRNKSVQIPSGFIDAYNRAQEALTPENAKESTDAVYRIVHDESVVVPVWVEKLLAAQTNNLHDSGWCEVSPILWYPENAWLSK